MANPSPRKGFTSLYRMYDAAGTLLYVGMTGHIPVRLDQHGGNKPWWALVARIDVEHFPLRSEAAAAEARAIRDEKPKYNVDKPLVRKFAQAVQQAKPFEIALETPASDGTPATPRERPSRSESVDIRLALLTEHVEALQALPMKTVRGALLRQIDAAIQEGKKPEVVRVALGRLRERSDRGPSMLPYLIHEVENLRDILEPPAN